MGFNFPSGQLIRAKVSVNGPRMTRIRQISTDLIRVNPSDLRHPWSTAGGILPGCLLGATLCALPSQSVTEPQPTNMLSSLASAIGGALVFCLISALRLPIQEFAVSGF